MFRSGCISEQIYDHLDFPKDTDCKGNIYELTDKRDALARSFPIFTKDGLRCKQQQAVDDFRKREEDWRTGQGHAQRIIFSAEKVFDEIIRITADRHLASISFAELNKFKMEDLANFITVRKETNPLKKVKIPGFSAKGNVILASQGKPCLLRLLAKQCVEDSVIAIIPDIPAPVLPVTITPMAEVRSYVPSTQVEDFLPTEEWILEASKIILLTSTNGQLQKWRNDPDGLRRKSKLLAENFWPVYQDSFR
jgi:hypothetical protein